MNSSLKIAIGVGMAMVILCFACEKKKVETRQEAIPETIKTTDYSYTVSTFKRNVNWSANDEIWQPVTIGLGISKGGLVETGEASAATLTGTLGDIVMLGDRAKIELLIEKLEKQADGSSLAIRSVALLKGIARFNVAKGNGTFVVETPSARVRVKGTDFIVTYDEKNGSTDVRVREGSVDVNEKKKTQKTYSLSKGQTLLGAGTTKPVQRSMTIKDSAMFKELQSPEKSQDVQTQSMPKETSAEIHSRLNTESNAVTSKETNAERVVSQQKIDSVQTDYNAAAQAEIDTFANRKAVAQTVVDSTKNTAKSTLDAERAKFREATSGTMKSTPSKSSEGAFDELERRKAAR